MRIPVLLLACLFPLVSFAAVVDCDDAAGDGLAMMERFLSGEWSGEGAFASGKRIAADAAFHPIVEGKWLAYTHADRPPGRYRAHGVLGLAPPGRMIMTLHDSSGGARFFSGAQWCNGRIVLDKQLDLARPGHALADAERERFLFERVADDRLKMTYQRGTDEGGWRLVDFVVFGRVPAQGRDADPGP
jgi:hypothetical protein